jgi:uncharacterized iron-regulated protein
MSHGIVKGSVGFMNVSIGPIHAWGLLFLAFLLTASGCAAPGLRITGQKTLAAPKEIYDLNSGRQLSLDQLIDRLAAYDIVFLGELHTHPGQHEHQLEIIRGLWSRNPRLVIGLELFEREHQGLLDDWIEGALDEKDFVHEVIHNVLTPDTFQVYWPLLDWAGKNEVRMLALNAPRRVTSQVARQGLDSLSQEDRALIARDLFIGPEAYKQRVVEAIDHHQGLMNPDNFFTAQVIWDETMAETLTAYLAGQEEPVRAVVIAGNEHVLKGHGIPSRVARRFEADQVKVVMLVPTEDAVLSGEDADFVWVTAEAPPVERLRLGVRLGRGNDGVVLVESVVTGSEAERIGLKPGDELIAMNGRPISSAMDLHRAAMQAGADVEHRLTVKRDGQEMPFHFYFRAKD